MDKQAMISDMKKSVGGSSFITVSQLTAYLGLKNHTRVKQDFLRGLDRVEKRYFIPDVCQNLMDKRTCL